MSPVVFPAWSVLVSLVWEVVVVGWGFWEGISGFHLVFQVYLGLGGGAYLGKSLIMGRMVVGGGGEGGSCTFGVRG